MMDINMPPDLDRVLGEEAAEFTVKSSRKMPLKQCIGMLVFGVFWLGFTSIFFFAFLGPIFMGKEVRFTSNNVPVVAGPGNLGPVIPPAIFIGIFMLIGIALVGYALYNLLSEGSWFIGTPKRLIIYGKSNVRSIDWEQFSGDIEVNGTPDKADISLKMRTGRMVSRKHGPDQYVPDCIYISGIKNAFEVQDICRKRIKENDPTPPAGSEGS